MGSPTASNADAKGTHSTDSCLGAKPEGTMTYILGTLLLSTCTARSLKPVCKANATTNLIESDSRRHSYDMPSVTQRLVHMLMPTNVRARFALWRPKLVERTVDDVLRWLVDGIWQRRD